MELLNPEVNASTEDLGRLTAIMGGSAPLGSSNESGFSTRHTVIIEVVEGQGFINEKQDRKYYVKLGLENGQWRTDFSLKSCHPAWREYFIGEFIGTKLESPSIAVTVKYRRTRSHLYGVCKIPLLSVTGTDSMDRWYDIMLSKPNGDAGSQSKLRLRITCRKAYDPKSEIEVEVQLINSLLGHERDLVAQKTAKIAELSANKDLKAKSKHKLQKMLRQITHSNKRIRALYARKQQLLDKARQRKIHLSPSEINLHVPARQQQSRAELHERLLTIRSKLKREQDAFDFHKRYSTEIDAGDKPDWTQNTDELKRRLDYLRHRERTYLTLLQDAMRKEKVEKGLTSSDELDAALEVHSSSVEPGPAQTELDNGGTKRRSMPSAEVDLSTSNSHPFPGVPFHPEWESFSALKGAKPEDVFYHSDDDDNNDPI